MNQLHLLQNMNSKNYHEQQDYFHIFSDSCGGPNAFSHLTNNYEFLAFIQAASLGEIKGVIQYLKQPYCDVNTTVNHDGHISWSAMHFAAHFGHYNVIKALLDYNADADKRDPEGVTPLMLAAQNGHTRCIEMLVGTGKANISLKDKNGFTASYYAIHYGHGNNKIIARLLKINYGNSNHSNYGNSNHSTYGGNHSNYSSYTNYGNNSIQQRHGNSGHQHSMNSNTLHAYSNDRSYNLVASPISNHNGSMNQNVSLNDDGGNHNFTFNSTAAERSFGESGRFSDLQQSMNQQQNLTNSSMLSDILNRNQLPDLNNNGLERNFNDRDKNARNHSFAGASQFLMNGGTTNDSYSRANLSLDLNSNTYRKNAISSADNCSPDQAYNSWQKQEASIFNYESSVFNSPSSESEHRSFNEQRAEGFKLENNFFDFSFNDSGDELNADSTNNQTRDKPRNSTFVADNLTTSSSSGSSNQVAPGKQSVMVDLEKKFAYLEHDLSEFLQKCGLKELNDRFAKKNVDLHTFLTLREDDLKNDFQINESANLAALIAGQLKFKETIGIQSSDSMDYVIYLGIQLDKVKKEVAKLKDEISFYQLDLKDIDLNNANGNKMQNINRPKY